MATTLQAGLLERLISLTESLLTTLGDKNDPTTSAALASNGHHHRFSGIENQCKGVSSQSRAQATSKESISLAPLEVSSNHVLHIKRTDGSSSADAAEQNKTRSVSWREAREGHAKSRFVLDKINKQRQVM
jgi:hypothetical protein